MRASREIPVKIRKSAFKNRHFSRWSVSSNMLLKWLCYSAICSMAYGTVLCPFPGLPAFGTVVDDSISWTNRRPFKVGETLEIQCPESRWLDLIQKQTIVCQANGQWSGPMPRCRFTARLRGFFLSENNCGWPPVPLNGDIASEFTLRQTTSASYKCDHHLVIDVNGTQNSVCNPKTGEWSSLPKCVCPDLRAANVKIVSGTDVSLQFKCDEGFRLIGNDTLTCNTPGDLKIPTCEPLSKKLSHTPLVLFAGIFFIIMVSTWITITRKRMKLNYPALEGTVQSTEQRVPSLPNCYVGPLEVNAVQEPIYEELDEFYKVSNFSPQEPIYLMMEPKNKLSSPHEECHSSKLSSIDDQKTEKDDLSIYVQWEPQLFTQDTI